MAQYYDRYDSFRTNGSMKPVVGIPISVDTSDKSVIYRQGKTRLDILSNKYYNTPYCGWLIMLANPEFGGLEFLIPDSEIIRIPYPFETAIDRYITALNKHKELYG
jgi:hypothetical protein